MNERIKELQKQALVQGHWSDDGERFIGAHVDMEKFAELIVRECAKVADDGFASSNFGNGITGDQLKKHFGVEE